MYEFQGSFSNREFEQILSSLTCTCNRVCFLRELCWGKAIATHTKPHRGKKGQPNGEEGREIRSSLFILDLKDDKLSDSGEQEEGKTFHKLPVLGTNEDLRDRVRRLGS